MQRPFIKTLFFIVFTLVCLNTAFGLSLPREDRVPGGIAAVNFHMRSRQTPVVYYRKRRVAVVPRAGDGNWTAVVGLSIYTKPGRKTLWVRYPRSRRLRFTVRNKRYKTQRLRVKKKNHVHPRPQDKVRIHRENAKMRHLVSRYTTAQPFQQRFVLPVNGRQSARFGLRRYYNGVRRSPHSGLDLVATVGTPVKATAPGVVIDAGRYFYTGKTVFIDHGHGVITAYAHLKRITVRRGMRVQQGTVIGRVGMTGRTTGPHLHWEAFLNQYRINPKLLLGKA